MNKFTSNPWISVIIPVLDAAHLGEALDSLRAQNDFEGIEVIVVDDGSPEDVRAIVEAWLPIAKVHRQENSGPAAARNKGSELASAPLVTFLDADDRLAASALARLRRAIEAAPQAAVVQGMVRRFDEARPSDTSFPGYNLGSAIIRRSALEEVGGFDPTLRVGEDVDLFARLKRNGHAAICIAHTVLEYRNSPEPSSSDLFERRLRTIRQFRTSNWSERVAEKSLTEPVTAALVVRDGMPHLPQAVESIRAQTHKVDRILAILGPSSDDTATWLAAQGDIEVIAQNGQGLSSARNEAIDAIEEGWLAFLDHDDLWAPNKIERQMRALQWLDQPAAALCRFETEDPSAPGMPVRVGWTPSALVAHRKVFETIGRFDAGLGLGCDTDWFRRLKMSDEICVSPTPFLMTKRRHGENLSASAPQNRAAMFAMIAKHRREAKSS